MSDHYRQLAGLVRLYGFKIVESVHLTRTIGWRTERPWKHRKRYQPARAFNYHSKQAPDDVVYRTVDSLVMHPAMAMRLRHELSIYGAQR